MSSDWTESFLHSLSLGGVDQGQPSTMSAHNHFSFSYDTSLPVCCRKKIWTVIFFWNKQLAAALCQYSTHKQGGTFAVQWVLALLSAVQFPGNTESGREYVLQTFRFLFYETVERWERRIKQNRGENGWHGIKVICKPRLSSRESSIYQCLCVQSGFSRL